jgi:ATP-dependent Clp protease ATP-binding subunit ClpA
VYPFERFTERAKKVLTLAQEEAEKSHHSYIGTEHLLIGLLREGDGLAARALADFGVEIEGVRTAIANVLGANERIRVQQIIPTSRVKKVIELAFEEAQRTTETHVGTQHLLLGLLIEGEGIAARVLQDLDIDAEKVRANLPAKVDEDSIGDQPIRGDLRSGDTRYYDTSESESESFSPRRRWFGSVNSCTSEALSALALAEEEAVKSALGYMGTEHLLLGLVRQAEGTAAQVRQEVARNPPPSPRLLVQTVLPTSGLRAVSALARRSALHEPSERVDTQHLLLAIAALDQESGARVLAALGVDRAAIQERVTRFDGGAMA